MKHVKACVVCGKTFYSPPKANKITCSSSCSIQNRKNKAAAGFNEKSLVKARIAYAKSPKTGPYETNKNAKEWTLIDSEGTIYTFRNLSKFIRDHIEEFDGSTENQAWAGISKLKYAEQGKLNKSKFDYKGWSLKSWDD